MTYTTADPSTCDTCHTGFTGAGGTAGARTSCDCDKVVKMDQNGDPICTDDITNCYKFNKDHANTCHTCDNLSAPVGAVANQADSCCAFP